MNIPGFSAETSLYKTSKHYRLSGKFGQSDTTLYPALLLSNLFSSSLGLTDLVNTSSLIGNLIYVDSPFPAATACGGLGKPCCRAPAKSQNIPAFGPVVSCQHGLGCDITTNKCVAGCGGVGQVCCDGPETRATRWTAEGWLYSPNSRNLREMCDEGVCDKQTHRCITCGTQAGGPCCSSDAAQATARCFRDARTGIRLVCNDPFVGAGSHCVECGKGGQPICLTAGEAPCDDGSVERASDGICVACGGAGQPTCDRGEPCRDGRSVPNRSFSECLPAGGPNQPCRPDGVNGGCDYQGLFCNSGHICQPCGNPGEICCPPGKLPGNAACQQPGECRDNSCFACGYDNMPVCTVGDPCKCLCKPVDGWCRPCGHDGQPCCDQPWWSCYDGAHCEDGICRRPSPPPPPPPPPQLKTCNGENWGFSTMDRTVFIKHAANQCIDGVSYKANSAQEAYTCARRDFGDAVVTQTIYSYKFALTSAFGCNTVSLFGTDDAGAQTCAQLQCINCTVTPGDCP